MFLVHARGYEEKIKNYMVSKIKEVVFCGGSSIGISLGDRIFNFVDFGVINFQFWSYLLCCSWPSKLKLGLEKLKNSNFRKICCWRFWAWLF